MGLGSHRSNLQKKNSQYAVVFLTGEAHHVAHWNSVSPDPARSYYMNFAKVSSHLTGTIVGYNRWGLSINSALHYCILTGQVPAPPLVVKTDQWHKDQQE